MLKAEFECQRSVFGYIPNADYYLGFSDVIFEESITEPLVHSIEIKTEEGLACFREIFPEVSEVEAVGKYLFDYNLRVYTIK